MRLKRVINMVPKLALWAAIVCALVIAVLSLLPGNDLPSPNLNDKLNHFIAYGVLMSLAVLGHDRGGRRLGLLMASVILYGLLLEAAQGLMPYGRSASWLDALANTGGVFIGAILGMVLQFALRRLGKI